MNVKRAVRIADNLLELLIFDVALATRLRRRIALLVAALAALVLYATSSLIFIERVGRPGEVLSGEPYVDDDAWESPGEIVALTVKDLQVPAGRMDALTVELARHEKAVVKLMDLAFDQNPPRLEATPWFRGMREAAEVLVARGVWLNAQEKGDEAMYHWIAAARLGRMVAIGSRTRPLLIQGMVGTSIERLAMRAIRHHMTAKRINHHQEGHLQKYLDWRATHRRTLSDYLAGEREFVREVAGRDLAAAELTLVADQAVQALMPLRRAERATFLREVFSGLDIQMHLVGASCRGNRASGPLPSLDFVGGVQPGAWSFARALVSRADAIRYVTGVLIQVGTPNLARAGERLEQLEQEVAVIDKDCDPMDLDSI